MVFDRLGVFAGTFDSGAATAIVAGDGVEVWDVVDALAGLVAKSMVIADESSVETTRYHVLETLRQYARERLEEHGGTDPLAPPPCAVLRGVRRGDGAGARGLRGLGLPPSRAHRARQPAQRGHVGARRPATPKTRCSASASWPRSSTK